VPNNLITNFSYVIRFYLYNFCIKFKFRCQHSVYVVISLAKYNTCILRNQTAFQRVVSNNRQTARADDTHRFSIRVFCCAVFANGVSNCAGSLQRGRRISTRRRFSYFLLSISTSVFPLTAVFISQLPFFPSACQLIGLSSLCLNPSKIQSFCSKAVTFVNIWRKIREKFRHK
jgi:hypothetical protein